MNLHIFNPETDYALAQGRKPYTPPKPIVGLRRRLALLPKVFCAPGDLVLVDDVADYPDEEGIVDWAGLPAITSQVRGVEPWGWNHTLLRRLLAAGIDAAIMPSAEDIDRWRMLSHRRQTIAFNRWMGHTPLPVELHDLEEARMWLAKQPTTFAKAPWSSAGRGVLYIDKDTPSCEGWLAGIIARQGSVMAEVAVDKALDFATEWHVDGEGVQFIGFSVFTADEKGNYLANEHRSQSELRRIIESKLGADVDLDAVVDRQREGLRQMLLTGDWDEETRRHPYRGYVGIDMMATVDGAIVPCVEINLRRTMGHAQISYK